MKRTQSRNTRLLVVIMALLALALLAGCRSKSKETPTEAPPPTDTVAAVEAAQPTEAPAPEPTETPAPEPTEAPTAEPTKASGAEPTEAPAAESGGEGVALAACSHPYYPIRDGAVYRYKMTSPDTGETEMNVEYRVTGPDTFVTVQSFGDVSTELEWKCTDKGLLRVSFGLTGLDVPGLEYNISDVSGFTFPPADQIKEGATWQSQYAMSGEMSTEGFTVKMNITAVTDSTLSAFEQVTTPAGTFDTAKIDSTTTVEMKMEGEGMPAVMPAIPGTTSSSTMWLAEGVGMVKSVSEDPSGQTVTELVSME